MNSKLETRNPKPSMRVAMYYNNRDVRLEEVPVPKIGPGELLLRTRASGVCGSDLMEWYRIKKAPLVLGHEITAGFASGSVHGLKSAIEWPTMCRAASAAIA
jgi:threonine dehydrogenase-like Zn-dependent dehydrogenase